MSNPAFIVDGQHEQKIVQKLCPGCPVRRLNCNGEQVDLTAAGKRAASLIRLLGESYYPIIIVFDREKRREPSNVVRDLLLRSIRDEGVTTECIAGIPDRMIENWILGDWGNLKTKAIMRGGRPSCIDGHNGKSFIGRKLPKGHYYHETIEGVEWFISASAREIYSCSESFKHFANAMRTLDCRWLRCIWEQ